MENELFHPWGERVRRPRKRKLNQQKRCRARAVWPEPSLQVLVSLGSRQHGPFRRKHELTWAPPHAHAHEPTPRFRREERKGAERRMPRFPRGWRAARTQRKQHDAPERAHTRVCITGGSTRRARSTRIGRSSAPLRRTASPTAADKPQEGSWVSAAPWQTPSGFARKARAAHHQAKARREPVGGTGPAADKATTDRRSCT